MDAAAQNPVGASSLTDSSFGVFEVLLFVRVVQVLLRRWLSLCRWGLFLGGRPLNWSEGNLLVAVRAAELVVKPLDAALLVEDMLALRHDLDLLPSLEGLEADRTVLVLLKYCSIAISCFLGL